MVLRKLGTVSAVSAITTVLSLLLSGCGWIEESAERRANELIAESQKLLEVDDLAGAFELANEARDMDKQSQAVMDHLDLLMKIQSSRFNFHEAEKSFSAGSWHSSIELYSAVTIEDTVRFESSRMATKQALTNDLEEALKSPDIKPLSEAISKMVEYRSDYPYLSDAIFELVTKHEEPITAKTLKLADKFIALGGESSADAIVGKAQVLLPDNKALKEKKRETSTLLSVKNGASSPEQRALVAALQSKCTRAGVISVTPAGAGNVSGGNPSKRFLVTASGIRTYWDVYSLTRTWDIGVVDGFGRGGDLAISLGCPVWIPWNK